MGMAIVSMPHKYGMAHAVMESASPRRQPVLRKVRSRRRNHERLMVHVRSGVW
jgi:hypothetical protein